MELNKIYNTDCIDGLKQLEADSIDLIFTDPPYNIKKNYGIYKDNLSEEEYYNWCKEWITECKRVLKPSGCIMIMNYPEHLSNLYIFMKQLGLHFVNWITWVRNDNQLYNKERKFKKNHQDIIFFGKTEDYYFNWRNVARKPIWYKDKRVKDMAGETDTWLITYVKGNSTEKTEVNNQLPINLLRRIILSTTEEGYTVLDPFSGSGTTALASKNLNRNYIGFEINPDYVKIAESRLAQKQLVGVETQPPFTPPLKSGGFSR